MLTTSGLEFRFPEPGPDMFELTCVNHPTGRWLTKNPDERSIHWCGWESPTGFGWRECPCPYRDLRVVEDETWRQVEADRRDEQDHVGRHGL